MGDAGPAARRSAEDALPDDIGRRLRAVREGRGISLRELSRRVAISPSALSQIENGHMRPSVTTLYSMVTELEMSLDDLLRVPGARPPAPPPAVHGTPASSAAAQTDDIVIGPKQRRTIDLGTGVRWERLTPLAEPNADFLFVAYAVGSSSSWEPIATRYAGRAYGLVLSGRIRVTLDLDEYELAPEDSIAFDTSTPHRVDNVGDEAATAVWVTVGPPRS